MALLDKKLPDKFELLQDPKDGTLRDITNLIENFERIFVGFINDNYRTFTESDLHRLIKDELKVAMLGKFKDLCGGDGSFSNADPHKIKQIIKKNQSLRDVNKTMRESIHSVGVTVNQLAKSSVMLKKEAFVSAGMDLHLRDIGSSIDKLNHLFNDVYLRVLENDSSINDVEVICKTTMSQQSHL